jgi:hypothetical protein
MRSRASATHTAGLQRIFFLPANMKKVTELFSGKSLLLAFVDDK